MLTGATPSVSGIIGNDWFDRETGATVTSVSDPTVKLLGSPTGSAASPRRLLVSTVGDELKMASLAAKGTPEAPRVFGVSLKDRSAILPVGRGADAALLVGHEDRQLRDQHVLHAPTCRPGCSRSTTGSWPTPMRARRGPGCRRPSTLASASSRPSAAPPLYDAIYGSPYGNELLVDFAGELLRREQLGTRNATDLLSVSFSSNDSVGHTYGPDSPQVRDIALRTDRTIGRLLNQIDKTVGLQHTLIAFTADHGVAPLPEFLRESGLPGGRMTTKELFDPMQQALVERFGDGKWLLATAGSSPYLNYELIDEASTSIRPRCAASPRPRRARSRTWPGSTPATSCCAARWPTTGSAAACCAGSTPSGPAISRSSWSRSGYARPQGATHGTPYNYDAHIPLILMGRRSDGRASTRIRWR